MKNFHGQFLCLIFDYKIVGKHALSNEIFLLTGIFFFDPGHKYIYHIVLLILSKLYALGNSDRVHSFLLNILPVLLLQMETAAEIGMGQTRKQIGNLP